MDGTHISENGFHPTMGAPAFGCKICIMSMCRPCHDVYEDKVRVSPSKRPKRTRRGEIKGGERMFHERKDTD